MPGGDGAVIDTGPALADGGFEPAFGTNGAVTGPASAVANLVPVHAGLLNNSNVTVPVGPGWPLTPVTVAVSLIVDPIGALVGV